MIKTAGKRYRLSNSYTGLDRPLGFQVIEAPRIYRHLTYVDVNVVSPKYRPPLPLRKYPLHHHVGRQELPVSRIQKVYTRQYCIHPKHETLTLFAARKSYLTT